MSKLIFIVGLTATGKTSLALQLAAEAITGGLFTGADIVSADSRQVFEGLKIVSGADVPEGFKSQIPSTKSQANDKFQSSNYKYYQNDDGIKLHGISIIKLKDEWSVAHFVQLASEVLERAKKAKRLVIIVGGTGLYHQKLWEAWETRSLGRQEAGTLGIKPDYQLRKKLEKLELCQLQNKLQKLDPEKWEQMNRSDKMNPRRLVRAIEVANVSVIPDRASPSEAWRSWDPGSLSNLVDSGSKPGMTLSCLVIGLTDTLENLEANIRLRVEERFSNGAVAEVKNLLAQNLDPNLPSMSATGVKEISLYLRGELTATECLQAWTLREFQYAKRQITWWKKHKNVKWLMVSGKDWRQKVPSTLKNF